MLALVSPIDWLKIDKGWGYFYKEIWGINVVCMIRLQAQDVQPAAISDPRRSECSRQAFSFSVTGSNHPFPRFLFLICFRTWRSESAWGSFCEWKATPGCSPPKDSGTCSSRCQALRHLQAASGQPWLCQQNPWQVKAGAPGFPWFLK